MITEEQVFYIVATTTYVVTALVISAVRWFHMCQPYDRHPDYYYPARKTITIVYLTAVLLIPYIVLPDRLGSWLLVKAYFLPADLYFMSILFFSYFGSVMHWRKWRRPTILWGSLALIALLSGPVISVFGQGAVNSRVLGYTIIYGLGILMTGLCLLSIFVVVRWARRIDVEDYSNPQDFPVSFAHRMSILMTVTMVLLWINALCDSPATMAVLQLLLSVFSVGVLIVSLRPHRHRDPDVEQEEAAQPVRPLSDARSKALASAIRRVVEEEEAFLESHLTLQDVASRCGTSRTYVAKAFSTEFGGFFTYVNTLRLNYADKYREAHPKASIAEIASESGFGSRQTYYTVRARLNKV